MPLFKSSQEQSYGAPPSYHFTNNDPYYAVDGHRSNYNAPYDAPTSSRTLRITIRHNETSPLCNHPHHYATSPSDDVGAGKNRLLVMLTILLFIVPALTFLYGLHFSEVPELLVPHPYWDVPSSERHCYSYGTRGYTAKLLNISTAYDRLYWCDRTPIEIHDVIFEKPNRCESRSGEVYGHWLVDVEEYKCLPHWNFFHNNGCTGPGSGYRRFSSRLMGIYYGEDWLRMCSTAPAEINHIFFASPTYCEHKGIFGMFGIWEVEDPSCD